MYHPLLVVVMVLLLLLLLLLMMTMMMTIKMLLLVMLLLLLSSTASPLLRSLHFPSPCVCRLSLASRCLASSETTCLAFALRKLVTYQSLHCTCPFGSWCAQRSAPVARPSSCLPLPFGRAARYTSPSVRSRPQFPHAFCSCSRSLYEVVVIVPPCGDRRVHDCWPSKDVQQLRGTSQLCCAYSGARSWSPPCSLANPLASAWPWAGCN
jgi:hypothetical protein